MKTFRNRIDIKLVSKKKDYLNQAICHKKICDNNFMAIRKSKVTLMFNKPAYIGMFILELSKVLRIPL